jgi:putative hydrolase of the HAD superfamily
MPGRNQPIRAVVFDLDDTLFLERQYVRSGLAAVAKHLRRRLGRKERFERWMWRRFCAGRREGMFDALYEHFGLGPSLIAANDAAMAPAPPIAKLVELYRRHRPAIRPARGVEALLKELRRRGFLLGLLSDGYQPAQRLKLEALGLARYFDAIVFTEDLGRKAWKPSPRGFAAIRTQLSHVRTRRLGKAAALVRPPHAACAYVADNPAKDFLPANKLGWLSVQFLRRGQLHAGNAAPVGGRPKAIVRSSGALIKALSARS